MGPANERHETEIGYGIDEAYRNQGYAAEALQKMCEWAFSQENVYYIQAKIESDPINIPSKKVLVKCGFIKTGSEEEKAELLFELEKPKSSFVSIYMCLGLSIGMYIGTSFDNIAIGMCIGISIGVALGAALDESDKNKRKRN
ncbi:hypothetical protein SDC9_88836 [bioreactor metagenome]|uniref:N-acetyltransferase domain-containing protein n=1 Tax=bioreactor metagenome TaxID=1076179 RepID=A0A644ZU47_9ZZZZ